MKRILFAGALALNLITASIANAHFVWVLRSGDAVHVRFGESAEEAEPELLKNVSQAKVWARVPAGRSGMAMVEVPLTLTPEQLSGPVDTRAEAIVAAHEYGVVAKGGAPFLLKYLAKQPLSPLPGKWAAINDAEHLPLEVTPAWKGRQLRLTVTWQGQPAAGLEVKATGCGLDETLTTDTAGTVMCEPKENGVLSVRARMIAETSGELDGKKYESIRTYSTLTLPVTVPAVEATTHHLPALPQGITSFGAAIAGDYVYVYGGHFGDAHHYSDAGQSGEFLRASLTSEQPQWETLPGGPKLTGLALVEHNGKLYRVGGFMAKNKEDEDQSLWSQESFACFDPATGTWTELPPMPTGRSSHDAAVLDGKLYVVGGWNMQGAENTTWHKTALVCDLNQSELKWEELPAPEFERRAVSLAAFNGCVYVIGGMTPANSITMDVSVYDRPKVSGPQLRRFRGPVWKDSGRRPLPPAIIS